MSKQHNFRWCKTGYVGYKLYFDDGRIRKGLAVSKESSLTRKRVTLDTDNYTVDLVSFIAEDCADGDYRVTLTKRD